MPRTVYGFLRGFFVLFAMVCGGVGCGTQAPVSAPIQEANPDEGEHTARDLAVGFIEGVSNNLYADSMFHFAADQELPAAERVAAFRNLERYIASGSWTPIYTAITVVDGQEDSADVYIKSAKVGWLLLMAAFDDEASQWKLVGYEIPERTFARPEDVPFGAYIEQSLSETRADAKPYVAGQKPDGVYFIE